MQMIFHVLLYFQSLSIICTNANPLIGDRVHPAEHKDYPFVFGLSDGRETGPATRFCTGILISNKHLLIEHDCLLKEYYSSDYRDKKDIIVTRTLDDLTYTRNRFRINNWQTYEEWANKKPEAFDDQLHHGLFIAELDNAIPNATPVKLYNRNKDDLHLEEVEAVGWGHPGEHAPRNYHNVEGVGWVISEHVPRTLHKASICVCSQPLHADLPENELHTSNSCFGEMTFLEDEDRGGPLLKDGQLIGIHKRVIENASNAPTKRNVHLSIDKYRNFIEYYANRGRDEAKSSCPFVKMPRFCSIQ